MVRPESLIKKRVQNKRQKSQLEKSKSTKCQIEKSKNSQQKVNHRPQLEKVKKKVKKSQPIEQVKKNVEKKVKTHQKKSEKKKFGSGQIDLFFDFLKLPDLTCF